MAGHRSTGPVALALAAADHLGWTWRGPWRLRRQGGEELALLEVDKGHWEHEVREALRRGAWRRAAKRRPRDLAGIGDGIDHVVTCALL